MAELRACNRSRKKVVLTHLNTIVLHFDNGNVSRAFRHLSTEFQELEMKLIASRTKPTLKYTYVVQLDRPTKKG